jgi:mRNA interferase MazF
MTSTTVKRGDIFYAELNPVVGSEQGGTRPVLVVQNDIGNQYSPTTIVVAITSQISKAKLPTHVEIQAERSGLEKDSVILAEQVRTIDKTRLKKKISSLDEEALVQVNLALEISMGLTGF